LGWNCVPISGLVKELEELKSKGGIAVAVDEETQRFAEKLKVRRGVEGTTKG